MLDTIFGQIGAILWLGVCAFAIGMGQEPERRAAGALVIAWLATLAVRRETDLAGGIWAVMAIELLLFVFLLLLGWKSNRTWPIWAAAFQSVTVLVHVVVMIDFRIRAIAYISAYTVGTYGVLISVAVGTVQAWRLKRAMGDVNKLRGLSSSD